MSRWSRSVTGFGLGRHWFEMRRGYSASIITEGCLNMPEISRFFGIIIYMNWREHRPMHFHAVYGEHEAVLTVDGKVYAGALSGRALSMVREWLALHRDEFELDWQLALQK